MQPADVTKVCRFCKSAKCVQCSVGDTLGAAAAVISADVCSFCSVGDKLQPCSAVLPPGRARETVHRHCSGAAPLQLRKRAAVSPDPDTCPWPIEEIAGDSTAESIAAVTTDRQIVVKSKGVNGISQ